MQCTKLASWRITHKVYKLWGSTWCQSLWTDSWTTVSLSAINLKEVAQWRNVEKLKKVQLHANALWQVGPTTDSQIFSIRFPCFTAQTSFSLPSPTKKDQNGGKADRHGQGFTFLYSANLTETCNASLWYGTASLWQHEENLGQMPKLLGW